MAIVARLKTCTRTLNGRNHNGKRYLKISVYSLNSKSLFIAENCNVFFLTAAATSREFGVHRAGSQLKIKSFWQHIRPKLRFKIGKGPIADLGPTDQTRVAALAKGRNKNDTGEST